MNETTPAVPQEKPRLRYPVTKILVAINCGIFAVMAIAGHAWPGLNDDQLQQWGADWGPLTLAGQWWRLLTSTFLHFDVWHLLGNMTVLWIIGKRAEQVFSRWVFLLLYLSCGVAGSIASQAFHQEDLSAGASAAIFGLAGALIAVYLMKGMTLSKRARWKLALLAVYTVYCVYPDKDYPDIDNAAHLGGLITGLCLGALLTSRFGERSSFRKQVFSATYSLFLVGCVAVRYFNGYVIPLGAANRALDAERPDEALRETGLVLAQRPSSVLANTFAADAYLKKNDYANAEAAARRALAEDPNNTHANYGLGLIEILAGRPSEALQLSVHMMKRRGSHSDGLELFTLAEDSLKEAEDSIKAGDDYLGERKYDQAIGAYQKALGANRNDYRVHRGLEKAYRAKGMKKEADVAATKAAELKPPDVEAR